MPEVEWLRDPDQGFQQGKVAGKLVLLDFSAAPM